MIIETDQQAELLIKSCKQMKSAWECYLKDPDAIGWDIEGLIQDADYALMQTRE